MKLSQRESILLAVFAVLLLLLVGGGLVWAGGRSLAGLIRENAALAERAANLQRAVDDRAVWEARDAWLNEHTDTFRSREDASAALLSHIETQARDAGMELTGREILGGGQEGTDAAEEDASSTYFQTATIRVRVQGEPEKVLPWLHSLQQPERLIGVTAEVIDAEGEFTAEIEVTKSYFEGEE
jgi:hypothetical protein